MGILLGLMILALTDAPRVSVCPSSTANLMSFQFDQVSGYGLEARLDRFSLGYYNLTLSTHSPGELLDAGHGWVYQRELELWEASALVHRSEMLDIGLGLNKIDSGSMGWQIFVEKTFGEIVTAKVGFRRIMMKKPVDSISATFSVDIIGAIKTSKMTASAQ